MDLNALAYLKKGLRDPLTALYYLTHGRRKVAELKVKHLVKALGYQGEVARYYKLINSYTDFHAHISKALGETYFGAVRSAEHLYVIVRISNPEIVVETGVAAGVSSAFILKALQDNNRGILYSIDLPDYDQEYLPNLKLQGKFPGVVIPEYVKGPGFAIPENVKGRWVLNIGKSKDVLLPLLNRISRVDIFLHDSEHTYENMMLEYATAWDYLPAGGLLLSHDIGWNSAFRDFTKGARRKAIEIYFTGMGAIVK